MFLTSVVEKETSSFDSGCLGRRSNCKRDWLWSRLPRTFSAVVRGSVRYWRVTTRVPWASSTFLHSALPLSERPGRISATPTGSSSIRSSAPWLTSFLRVRSAQRDRLTVASSTLKATSGTAGEVGVVRHLAVQSPITDLPSISQRSTYLGPPQTNTDRATARPNPTSGMTHRSSAGPPSQATAMLSGIPNSKQLTIASPARSSRSRSSRDPRINDLAHHQVNNTRTVVRDADATVLRNTDRRGRGLSPDKVECE